VNTALGKVFLSSPRLVTCACSGVKSHAISPLRGWLTRSSNELKYIAAKMASQFSYRQSADLLHELLGVDIRFSTSLSETPCSRRVLGWITMKRYNRLQTGADLGTAVLK
jgi:hypothetical protein